MIPVNADEISTVIREVLHASLGVDEPCVPADPHPETTPLWSAVVGVEGGWQGAVAVRVPRDCVTAVAAAMLSIPAEEVMDADARDALAELTNIIGGNVRAVISSKLGAHCTLSLPQVAQDATAKVPPTALRHRVRCGVHDVTVVVAERREAIVLVEQVRSSGPQGAA